MFDPASTSAVIRRGRTPRLIIDESRKRIRTNAWELLSGQSISVNVQALKKGTKLYIGSEVREINSKTIRILYPYIYSQVLRL